MIPQTQTAQELVKIQEVFSEFDLGAKPDVVLNNLAAFEQSIAGYGDNDYAPAIVKWYKSRFLQAAGCYPRAEQLLDEALSILEETADPLSLRWRLKTYLSLGYVHLAQRNYLDVEFYLQQAHALAHTHAALSKYRVTISSMLGRVNITLQRFSQARTHITLEKDAAFEQYMEDLSDDSSRTAYHYAYSLVNYARIHRLIGSSSEGLNQLLEEAVSLFEKFRHPKGLLRARLEQAELQYSLKQLEKALEGARSLQKQCIERTLYREAMQAMLLCLKGHQAAFEYDQAERKFNELIILAKKQGLEQEQSIADAFYEMGSVLYATNRESEALECFRRSAKAGMILGIKPLIIRAFNAARLIQKGKAEEFLHADLVYQDALFVKDRIVQNINPFTSFKSKAKLFASTLFVDVTGFSSLLKKANDEQSLKMIDELIDRLYLIVYHYQGYIDKFQGDGFVAVFEHGYDVKPQAALNAIAAGVDIQRALRHKNRKLRNVYGVGNDITVRMGVSTGEIYAIILGNYIKREFTYLGSAVTLAADPEGKGQDHVMMIDEDTYCLAKDRIIAEPESAAPPHEGGTNVYQVFRLARMKERPREGARPSMGKGR